MEKLGGGAVVHGHLDVLDRHPDIDDGGRPGGAHVLAADHDRDVLLRPCPVGIVRDRHERVRPRLRVHLVGRAPNRCVGDHLELLAGEGRAGGPLRRIRDVGQVVDGVARGADVAREKDVRLRRGPIVAPKPEEQLLREDQHRLLPLIQPGLDRRFLGRRERLVASALLARVPDQRAVPGQRRHGRRRGHRPIRDHEGVVAQALPLQQRRKCGVRRGRGRVRRVDVVVATVEVDEKRLARQRLRAGAAQPAATHPRCAGCAPGPAGARLRPAAAAAASDG